MLRGPGGPGTSSLKQESMAATPAELSYADPRWMFVRCCQRGEVVLRRDREAGTTQPAWHFLQGTVAQPHLPRCSTWGTYKCLWTNLQAIVIKFGIAEGGALGLIPKAALFSCALRWEALLCSESHTSLSPTEEESPWLGKSVFLPVSSHGWQVLIWLGAFGSVWPSRLWEEVLEMPASGFCLKPRPDNNQSTFILWEPELRGGWQMEQSGQVKCSSYPGWLHEGWGGDIHLPPWCPHEWPRGWEGQKFPVDMC